MILIFTFYPLVLPHLPTFFPLNLFFTSVSIHFVSLNLIRVYCVITGSGPIDNLRQ